MFWWGERLMKDFRTIFMSYRTIFIWIGIFAVIGIVLLIVACETGVLTARSGYAETGADQEIHDGVTDDMDKIPDENENEEGEGKQDGTDQPAPSDEPKRLTVGKPYSVKLVEDGARNILIIGQDKVNALYDTIGIVSVDKKNKNVKIIMIPRDTYIEYNDEIKAVLDKKNKLHEAGYHKLNNTHHVGRDIDYSGRFDSGPISFLADVIEEKFNVEIHDYVKINVNGFRELIDHLGGVDINVPYRMYYVDPVQDLVIDLWPGYQHLDGHGAEGFVRFRQGYREDGTLFDIGDVGRKKNQLYFLKELIKQKGTLKNVDKIPGTIKILGKNIQHSIGLGDVLTSYMGMAVDVITNDYEIITESLTSNKMIRIDGSSYIVLE